MTYPSVQVLIVDDEPAIRFTLSLMLQRSGYVVTTAADSTEALKLLQAQTFDLLLLDLILPGMNGVVLAQCAHKLQPAAAVLILSGSQEFGSEMNDAERNGFDWMYKTASPQEVLDCVAALISR